MTTIEKLLCGACAIVLAIIIGIAIAILFINADVVRSIL